jgi:hypothetical protein
LDVELSALSRLSEELKSLGWGLLRRISTFQVASPGVTAIPDAAPDMPSLLAARSVSTHTITELEGTVANRFIEVGYLVDHVQKRFREADDLNHDRVFAIHHAGSLLPGRANAAGG